MAPRGVEQKETLCQRSLPVIADIGFCKVPSHRRRPRAFQGAVKDRGHSRRNDQISTASRRRHQQALQRQSEGGMGAMDGRFSTRHNRRRQEKDDLRRSSSTSLREFQCDY
ncbi:unnamed protein product [Cylicocyclus nassatus]|uniref:Uncharacterized protein n=1 Tax=Cylicocyclus nassatus TaxID=53992 RepID=A0AA36GS81_CYLNA|nr:unnamed protein product [Cylicocyclus nassatus]